MDGALNTVVNLNQTSALVAQVTGAEREELERLRRENRQLRSVRVVLSPTRWSAAARQRAK